MKKNRFFVFLYNAYNMYNLLIINYLYIYNNIYNVNK